MKVFSPKAKSGYTPEELFPRVELLCHFLEQNEHVAGVALTGSLARLEPRVNDIDLVVLHDGYFKDGRYQDAKDFKIVMTKNDGYGTIAETSFKDDILTRLLCEARLGVPVDYIVIEEKALWDCDYIKSLKKIEGMPDFYLRILCDLPLFLMTLEPTGALSQHMNGVPPSHLTTYTADAAHQFGYQGIPISHTCKYVNSNCRPSISWSDCKAQIKERKRKQGLL